MAAFKCVEWSERVALQYHMYERSRGTGGRNRDLNWEGGNRLFWLIGANVGTNRGALTWGRAARP